MNVVARSGSHAFLVKLEHNRGVVLDITGEPTVSQVMSLDAASNGGRWETFDGDASRVIELTLRILGEGIELPAIGFDVQGGARRLPGVHVEPHDLEGPLVGVHGLGVSELRHGNAATFSFGARVYTRETRTTSVA